ncbi:endonuclease/exonuclease/phosphatase family protein [bacterium]|nr:endonuclease/exonuclease/phosphatase family protein [bacterium]
MMYYLLKRLIRPRDERERAVKNLIALRKQLDREIPGKDLGGHLLLATWNIRDFGRTGNRWGYGKRIRESHFYIAEVLSRFDVVAVQEVNKLDELETVMEILGPDYEYIATDRDTNVGANDERMAFIWDKRKVRFQHIAGEIVLPDSMLISKVRLDTGSGKKVNAGKQFRRSPFVVTFQSGWLKFDLCTVHIYYGDDDEDSEKLQERVEEIDRIAKWLSKRADKDLKDNKALILLGDFNIVNPNHKTMDALLDSGFTVPEVLRKRSNVKSDMYYDQIAFKTDSLTIDYIEAASAEDTVAGVFNIFQNVMKPSQAGDYLEEMKETTGAAGKTDDELKGAYFKKWRTYQFSDHMPLWVRLRTDSSEAYLKRMQEDLTD